MIRRREMYRVQEAHDRLLDQLGRMAQDLGEVLGIALVALEAPELATRQLEELVETAWRRSELHGDLAPHWRTAAAVLAAKTKTKTTTTTTTTGLGPDASDGGA